MLLKRLRLLRALWRFRAQIPPRLSRIARATPRGAAGLTLIGASATSREPAPTYRSLLEMEAAAGPDPACRRTGGNRLGPSLLPAPETGGQHDDGARQRDRVPDPQSPRRPLP